MSEYKKSELNKVVRGSKRASYNIEEINEILDAKFLCNIGYVYENKAIVLPTAYARKDNTIYIHGSLKNRMMLHLIHVGEASLSVTHLDGLVLARSAFHHSANYRSATVFGKARRVEDPEEKLEAMKYIINHMIPNHWEHIRHPNEKEFNATLVIAIKIDVASAKIRNEGVIDEKEDYQSSFWAGVVPIREIAGNPLPDKFIKEAIDTPVSVLNYIKQKNNA